MRGHIRRRGRDSWSVVVDLGRDPGTRKRRQLWRTIRGTKREAEALLAQLIHQQETGVDAPPGRLKVAEYAASWLKNYAASHTAPTTYRRYEELLRRHLLPSIGELALAKLRPLHIQDAYSRMLAAGLSPRTVVQAHRVLREALHQAVRWQVLARNPADAVEPPRYPRFEPRTLGTRELRLLFEASVGTRYGPIIRTAAGTGLRLGELLGLRWQDVDLRAGTLHVRQTCQWLSGKGYCFGRPKTHRSSRPVALPRSTVKILREQRSL